MSNMLSVETRIEHWAMREPFEISREVITHQSVLYLRLRDRDGFYGQAEAAGVDYDGETPARLQAQIEALRPALHAGITPEALQSLLGPGGARNALDCALWDLRAKRSATPVWQHGGGKPWQAVRTAYTLGLGDEASTRRKARAARGYALLKLKVDATRHLDVVRWVREEHPAARIVVDANQAWSLELLRRLLPALAEAGVELVEQPLPRGQDAALQGLNPPIPLAADESCTDRASLPALLGRYQFANIKLDKCGGLTEALALAREARAQGLGLMVGNMCGTSLAMAPAFALAQQCDYVDLDGPLLQTEDRAPTMRYEGDYLHGPETALWG